jgi:hypothetical protein
VPGKLEMIVGPMRSNETAELLRRIETRREYARQHVLLLKPSADTKAAAGLVESRNGCGKQPYGTGGLLQLRRQGAVPPAPDRGQAGFLCQPHHHGRRFLRAALRRTFCSARQTALRRPTHRFTESKPRCVVGAGAPACFAPRGGRKHSGFAGFLRSVTRFAGSVIS